MGGPRNRFQKVFFLTVDVLVGAFSFYGFVVLGLAFGIYLERNAPNVVFPGVWLDAWLLLATILILVQSFRTETMEAREARREREAELERIRNIVPPEVFKP